jgi:hypothetical protein
MQITNGDAVVIFKYTQRCRIMSEQQSVLWFSEFKVLD